MLNLATLRATWQQQPDRPPLLLFYTPYPPTGSIPQQLTRACLSQWWPAPFTVDGRAYRTAEHYMMWAKAALFDDWLSAALVLQSRHPRQAKLIGRNVQGFNQAIWEAARISIVTHANQAKFGQNPALGQFLARTGKAILAEASPTDTIWGIGRPAASRMAADPRYWRGLNLLGFILMHIRDNTSGRPDSRVGHSAT